MKDSMKARMMYHDDDDDDVEEKYMYSHNIKYTNKYLLQRSTTMPVTKRYLIRII